MRNDVVIQFSATDVRCRCGLPQQLAVFISPYAEKRWLICENKHSMVLYWSKDEEKTDESA